MRALLRAQPLVMLFLLAGSGTVQAAPSLTLEPLEECTAPEPAASAEDPHPEVISTVEGKAADGHDFSHGRGYIHAPIGEVYKAMQDPTVLMDRRKINEWSVEKDVDPSFPVSFTTHCIVHRFITVRFDLTWIEGVTEGSQQAPETVMERAEKTGGSEYVQAAASSIIARQIDENTTSVEIVLWGKGPTLQPSDMTQSLTDLYNSLVARVHGEPLPKTR